MQMTRFVLIYVALMTLVVMASNFLVQFPVNGRFGLTSPESLTIEPRLSKKARRTAAGFGAGNVLS